jgi:hypothetical protein
MSKHSISFITTNRLMLCREIIAVYSESRTRHVYRLCGQSVESLTHLVVRKVNTKN